MSKITLLPPIQELADQLDRDNLPAERKQVLEELIRYIQSKVDNGESVNLNFICTHNSRRSQFSQIWAQVFADYFGVKAACCSGGVEVTAFNERAVSSLERSGFQVFKKGDENPVYEVTYAKDKPPVRAYSKLFDDPANAGGEFAAVMTCAHADENCPFIPGAKARIPVRYEDPKAWDDTPEEAARYDERSRQIAGEMFYVFSKIH